MKNCKNINCNQNNPQPFSSFQKDTIKKDGHSSYCKICHNKRVKDNYIKNKKSIIKQQKEYYQKHREKRLKQTKIRHIEKTYNITYTEFINLLEKQNNKCAICNKEETAKERNRKIRMLSVDHCHKTGKVRGLLCRQCNIGIGNFFDSIELLEKTIKYLKDSK